MSDGPVDSGKRQRKRPRLTLVVPERSDEGDEEKTPEGRDRERSIALARKALLRHTSAIHIEIDDSRKRKAVSEALARWGVAPKRQRSRKRFVIAVVALGIAIALPFPIYLTSQDSLPGDPLWQVKHAGESMRQWLARGPTAEAQVALEIAGERLDEAERLYTQERFEGARNALRLFYAQFDTARRRLRAVPKESHPDLYREADRQLEKAAFLDDRLNGEAAHSSAPKGPDTVGTLSPTPRPPWEPENPRENSR